jgi:deoxyhypusine synthase
VFKVYAEATIAFPLIVAASFAKANPAAKDGQTSAPTAQ